MAKMLDFNAIQQPTWAVKLKDKDGTVVHLTAPSVDLLDKLMANAPELKAMTDKNDTGAIRKVYELVADLMNCNDDGLTFDADELAGKYRLSLLDIFRFVAGYFEFIKEIQDAKN